MHGGPSATHTRGIPVPVATRTMHDDRVPNASRCTQLAAFGRSSASGFLWSASARSECLGHPVTVSRGAEGRPYQVDLRGGLVERPVLEHMDPGRQRHGGAARRVGEVDEEQRGAVPDEEPGAVVLRRAVCREERVDRLGRACVSGQEQGQLAAGALGRVLGLAQRLVGEPGTHAVLIHREPGAT